MNVQFKVTLPPMAFTIASLHIYPVKGLKGIDLPAARCTERGLEHDRRWMVVDGDGDFLTQRSHPLMATIWTELQDGTLELSAPHMDPVAVPLVPAAGPAMKVRVWNSVVDAVPVSRFADSWLTEYLGQPLRLVYMPEATHRLSNKQYTGGDDRLVGFADAYAYLLVGRSSLGDLNARLRDKGSPAMPMNRFRPNIVIEGSEPYAEDAWGDVRLGDDAVLRAAKPCGRCQVTTTDQSTGEVRGPEPLHTLSSYREHKEFGPLFGMNYVTVRNGLVRVGDKVEVVG
jgi:uncharacterized protein